MSKISLRLVFRLRYQLFPERWMAARRADSMPLVIQMKFWFEMQLACRFRQRSRHGTCAIGARRGYRASARRQDGRWTRRVRLSGRFETG